MAQPFDKSRMNDTAYVLDHLRNDPSMDWRESDETFSLRGLVFFFHECSKSHYSRTRGRILALLNAEV